MKAHFYAIVFFSACLSLFTFSSAHAQFQDDGLVIRSGIGFQAYKLYAYPGIADGTPDQKEFTYSFSPGIGKFYGNGYYVGVQALASFTNGHYISEVVNGNISTINAKQQRFGGGILLRKYFNVSKKISPFIGLNSGFYRESSDDVLDLYEENKLRSNVFRSDLQIGLQYRVSPRIGLEAYYTLGGLMYEKSLYSDHNDGIQPNFGQQGRSFSIGINYFLQKK